MAALLQQRTEMQFSLARPTLEHSKTASLQQKMQMRFNVESIALENSKILFLQQGSRSQFSVALDKRIHAAEGADVITVNVACLAPGH